MGSIDESDEKPVSDIADEPEENENVNSSEELEKEKQKTNEFVAEGNMAQYQIFIQNYNEYDKGIRQILNAVSADGNRKKYDLCQADKCVEFVETYRDSEYVAVAVILCVFEFVSLAALPELRKVFIKNLPKVERPGQEESVHIINGDPYLSIDTLTGVIGGQRFAMKDGQTCISLGENSKQALFNVMDLFPALRDTIVSGLIQAYESYQCRTALSIYQMATAFARVSSFDIEYAEQHIFPQLCSDSGNTGLLGILMCKLYEDDSTRKMTHSILSRRLGSDGKWWWRPVCITYSFLAESDNHVSFETALERALCRRIQDFKADDLLFMASILMQSMAFREMTARVFHSLFQEADQQDKKLVLASIYLRLLRYCYFRVNKKFNKLPLAACDTGTQQKLLSPLLGQIMSRYALRKQHYAILAAYIKEISDYGFPSYIINHIAAHFYYLAGTEKSNRRDVMDFLDRCEGAAARRIYERLQKKYMKETGE